MSLFGSLLLCACGENDSPQAVRETSQGGAAGAPSSGGASGSSAAPSGGHTSVGGSAGAPNTETICPPGPFPSPFEAEVPAELQAELEIDATSNGPAGEVLDAEGPLWVASQGALFFSDKSWKVNGTWEHPATSRIWKYVPGEGLELHVTESGSNGLALDGQGRIVAATHSNDNLTVYDAGEPNTVLELLLETAAAGEPDLYNSPNDLAISSAGHIYFSDPSWQDGGDDDTRPQALYWRAPSGEVTLVDTFGANGVTLSPDEQTLYATGGGTTVRKYTVGANGEPAKAGSHATTVGGSTDGMVADCAGNLYVASSEGVEVFDAAGVKLGTVRVAAPGAEKTGATNAAFGGADRKTLYVTRGAGLGVWAVRLNVPGFPY